MGQESSGEQPSSRAYERQFLRTELAANKKLVFERALVIVAAGLAASLLPKDSQGVQLVGIPTIGALGFSLWLTANRLKSNSRIIAYLQLFHEADNTLSWVGWETALRLHRIFLHQSRDRPDQRQRETAIATQYDNLTFYRPIFFLHLAMAVLVAVLMSFAAWVATPFTTPLGPVPNYAIPAINGVLAAVLCAWSVRYRPRKLQDGIEYNRLLWRAVFTAFAAGELDSKKGL
jgi:hypothetical protein